MNEVVCKHRTDIEGQIFCQKKKEFIKQPTKLKGKRSKWVKENRKTL